MFPGGFRKGNSTVCKLNYLGEGFGSILCCVKGYFLPCIMESFRVYSKNFWQWEFRSVCFIEMQLIRGWICDLFIPSSMYVSCLQINSTSVIMHLVVLLGLVFQLRLGCSAKYFTVPVALCSLFIWALHSMLLFLCWDLEEVVGKYQANTVLSGRQVWHS